MADKKNVVGFKRFSELKSKPGVEEVDLSLTPKTDSDIPMNPNLPEESNKIERIASRKNLIPKDQNLEVDTDADNFDNDIDLDDEKNESNVDFTGKIAKFPKNVKASKAYNFLENVKVSKKSIWYIMVEKDNELQMVKYNVKEGVDLNKFVSDLKTYYVNKYKSSPKVCESINKIHVDGNDKYSMIRNIPALKLDNRLLITTITEDLIKLLSK
jgi:hypothetical protein